MTYETTAGGGVTERIEIEILPEKMQIEGFEAIVYLDKEYKNGQLVEETRDYLAQHRNGDVWYFGEDVNNYWNGLLMHHAGSFRHGKDGAKAGIWMKADQRVGDSYRQEFYIGNAEDMRDTVATGQTVSTKTRKYTDCVKVLDWSPLENAREHKYYCPEVEVIGPHRGPRDGQSVRTRKCCPAVGSMRGLGFDRLNQRAEAEQGDADHLRGSPFPPGQMPRGGFHGGRACLRAVPERSRRNRKCRW